MRNDLREKAARMAAEYIRVECNYRGGCDYFENYENAIGLVLGTGWGDVLPINRPVEIPFTDIPGFEKLEFLEGHKRCLIIGYVADKLVLVLSGRVHMNEAPCDPDIPKMARLQIEMLLQLGVTQIISTCAVGSLHPNVSVGGIGVVTGFVQLFAPEMPLWAGEFVSPEDVINENMVEIAVQSRGELKIWKVGHAMVRGPQFESKKFDKAILQKSGAQVVGMSLLPDACIAALYNAKFLGLCFVTNSAVETHSHEENMARVKKTSVQLGKYLEEIVKQL